MAGPVDPVLRQLEQIIDRVGWAVAGVVPTSPGEAPFAYTVGLTAHGYPELGMAGLDIGTMYGLLHTLARRVYDRAILFEPGQRIGDLLAGGYEVVLVAGEPDRRELWPGAAYARYGRSRVRLLQVVWPDEGGRFPWDPGYALPPGMQPVIGRPDQTWTLGGHSGAN